MQLDMDIQYAIEAFQFQTPTVRVIKPGVLQVTAQDEQEYAIKLMGMPKHRLRFINQALHRIRTHGFLNIAWHERGNETQWYVPLKKAHEAFLVQTPWIVGRHPLADSAEDLIACASALGNFHRAGQGMADGIDPSEMLGAWQKIQDFDLMVLRTWISKYKTLVKNKQLRESLLNHGPQWLARAERAKHQLERSHYHRLCQQAHERGAICHGDSGAKNFVLTEQGTFLIDFETLRVDLQVFDVFRMIRLAGKDNGWDFDLAKVALDAYQGEQPISDDERRALSSLLEFPYKAARILKRTGRTEQSQAIAAELLEHSAKSEEALSIFISQLLTLP